MDENIWAISNLGGNMSVLVGHFFFGFFILWVVELRLCSACQRFSFRSVPPPKMDDELDLDGDVLTEEERVRGQEF